MKTRKPLPMLSWTLAPATQTKIRGDSLDNVETLTVTIYNDGANPLTGFEVRGAVDAALPQGGVPPAAVSLQSDGFYPNPSSVVYYASKDPKTLPASDSVLLKFEASDLDRIELYATSTLGTTVRVYASGFTYSS